MDMVKIEGDEIVIRIPIKDLSGAAFEGLTDCDYEDDDGMDFDQLAKDIVSQLNAEEEDGSTKVNLMLDDAVRDASESGAHAFSYQA